MIKDLNSLSEVKGIHKGHRAIVLGCGPSLDRIDFDCMDKNDIIFACNQSITVLKHCNYFCMTDGSIPEALFFEYGISITDKVAFCSGRSFIEFPPVISRYKILKDKAYFFNRRYNDRFNMNFNLDDGLLVGGTDVIHITAHLAHITGCSPIILAGVDLNYTGGRRYCSNSEFSGEIIWTAAHLSSHYKNLNDSLNTWKKIKQENKNIMFYNASPTGRLAEIFEPISLPIKGDKNARPN